jgi:phosphoserine aminotransferase
VSERIYNFSAGPAVLPEDVLRNAQQALWNLDGSGIGVLEHSHRGRHFTAVIERAEADLRQLAAIPDEYAVLFLQGGASLQFSMVPMNLLGPGQTADYIDTGVWSQKAIQEARKIGQVHVAGSSEDQNFSYIPGASAIRWSPGAAYAHFTSNNTIFGTQWAGEPTPPDRVPLVCDASSDLFCRPIDVRKYGLVYAGAQKNLGPSGITLLLLRKDLADRAPTSLPSMLQYRTHLGERSLYNTPNTFGVYLVGQMARWLLDRGGLTAMAERNQDKAALIYDYLEQSQLFRATAQPGSRSLMNVCFRSTSEALDREFLAEAEAHGLSGLRGHRLVGGMRASIYNAFPRAGCQALVDFLERFERRHR